MKRALFYYCYAYERDETGVSSRGKIDITFKN